MININNVYRLYLNYDNAYINANIFSKPEEIRKSENQKIRPNREDVRRGGRLVAKSSE